MRPLTNIIHKKVPRIRSEISSKSRGSSKTRLSQKKFYLTILGFLLLAIKSIHGTTNYTATFTQLRTLFDELTRILNHLLAVGCHALDVGSMASVF